MMFMQSTLSGSKTKPNKRKSAGKKKLFRDYKSSGKNGFKGFITDSQLPHGKRKTEAKGNINLQSITPWKVILTSSLIGICGILYITHVFNTQQLLQEVQLLENEYNQVDRVHAERRLAYDRMAGPKEIYQRAREQGFINAGPADQIIILKK